MNTTYDTSPEGVATSGRDLRRRRMLVPMGVLTGVAGLVVAGRGALTVSYELSRRVLQLRAGGLPVTVGGGHPIEAFGEAFFEAPFTALGSTAVGLTLLGQVALHLLWTGTLVAIGMFMIRAQRHLFDRAGQRWLSVAVTCAMLASCAAMPLIIGGTNAALGDLGLTSARPAGNDLLIYGGLLAAYILICLRLAVAVGAAQHDELAAVV